MRSKETSVYEIVLANFIEREGVYVLHADREKMDIATLYESELGNTLGFIGMGEEDDHFQKTEVGNKYYYGLYTLRDSMTVVQEFLQRQEANPFAYKLKRSGQINLTTPFGHYLSYKMIIEYLKYLESNFPERVSLITMDITKGNRPLYTVIIKSGILNNTIVFVAGGFAGREWITISAALYLIKELATNIKDHPELKYLDWIIMPVVNPDGYEYSSQHKHQRLWRKNRNCMKGECKKDCGVDLTKNFPFSFGGVGASMFPCSDLYRGFATLSERESRALEIMMLKNRQFIKLYVGLETYGSYVLYPFAAYGKELEDADEIIELGNRAATEMNNYRFSKPKQTYIRNYTTGNYAECKHYSAGSPLDFAKAVLNIPFTYIIDIRRGKSKFYAYSPSSEEILPLVEETFLGIKSLAKDVYLRYPPPKKNLKQALFSNMRTHRRRRMWSKGSQILSSNSLLNVLLYVYSYLVSDIIFK